MIYKQRRKSNELQIWEALYHRMNLSVEDKKYYLNLAKGFEGELRFDSYTENLECDCLILNDLQLASNNNTFQIDSLMITAETIFIYEVKNNEGNYYYEADNFFNMRHSEILNPLHQVSRKESLLRPLLRKQGYNLPIDSKVVFINADFTLYQAPMNKPIIYPNQIKKYFHKINAIPSKLNKRHRLLAEKLVSLHITNPMKQKMPSYEYTHLQKGISCEKCKSLSVFVEGKKCVCKKCTHIEKVARAVVRSAKEFKLLFPNLKMTTGIIYDWCTIIESKKRVKLILDNHFKTIGKRRWLYYE